MSDCQRCAALCMIANDPTLSRDDMAQLAADAMENQPSCIRPVNYATYAIADYQKIAAMAEPSYDPDDPDNPMLELLLPSVAKIQAG
jgi:hypothetical protein